MERLDPGAAVTARSFVASLDLTAEPDGPRPRVLGVMIASVDGRATVDGRSVKLGHPDDRALLRELRTGVDAVLAGSRTIEAERYATLLDDDQRAWRREHGLPEHPLVVTVSRGGELRTTSVPILCEPDTPVVVYTAPAAGDGPSDLVATTSRALEDLSLRAVLEDLRARDGVRSVLCEGGPALLSRLVAEDDVDDLLLTVAPLLVGGDGPTTLEGGALDGPPRMALAAVHRADDHLFLHYRRREAA